MIWPYAALALLSGAALAAQVGLNNELRGRIGHPIWAAVASFGTGTLGLLAVVLLIRPPFPNASELAGGPRWMWLGGLVGAGYILTTIGFSRKLGAAGWLGVVVTGQILTSVALDHYGWIGFAPHPVSGWRLLGVALLLAGSAIVLRT